DSTSHTTTLGSADTTTYSGYTVYPAAVSTLKSGAVSVALPGLDKSGNAVSVVSLNNLNKNDARGSFAGTTSSVTGDYSVYANYYNRQPNNESNNMLTDDVYLDVWKVKNSAQSQSGTLTEPIMRIVPTATDAANAGDVMRFAFTNGADRFSMAPAFGTANSYQDWERNYADFNNVAFTYDSAGNSYGIATGLDTYPNGTTTYAGRMTFISSRWGIGNNNMNDNYYGYHKVRLESIGILKDAYVQGTVQGASYIMDTKRFSSPSLATAVHGTGTGTANASKAITSVYLAYYDRFQNQIRFRYGTFSDSTATQTNVGFATNNPNNDGNSAPTLTGGGNFGQFVDQHAALDTKGAEGHFIGGGNNDAARVAFDAAHSDYSLIAGKSTGNASANSVVDTGNLADKYVAIDVVTGTDAAHDVVVAVWFDGSNLKYSYIVNPYSGNNADQTHASQEGFWSIPITIFTDGGKYCAIKVDANGGIHIAAEDSSNQDLKYAYLSSYDASYNEANAVTVDSYAIVGTQIQIDTEIESGKVIPYISYYNGATMKPKMAYLVLQDTMDYTAAGADATTELLTGKWEVTLVPTSSSVQDDHINIGLWKTQAGAKRLNPTQTGTDSVSGAIGSTTEVSYGNGTTNPVVGYAIVNGTQGYIETAQKQ
ncbi:MAG TPA: hypothetical protein PK542_09875, partial [Treponemataceae bacterium]|nr:hypothetical protein [Treponemataceae bacterium]